MKEYDIRPESLLSRYLELSAADAERCFSSATRSWIPCVACGSAEFFSEFEKYGFGYATCADCGSLFQVPRPPIDAFEAFYRDSASSRYWAEVFFPAVAEVRRDQIFKPRAKKLSDLLSSKGHAVRKVIDVGAGYGILLDEWRRLNPDATMLAIEPSAVLAKECRAKKLDVVEDLVENVSGYDGFADLVVCFEVFEHVYNPLSFIRTLATLAQPGGYVFVSTLGVDGFDIQVLWEKSNSIFPPHHINFLSLQGFVRIFERAGLEDIQITTPGVLDIEIVRNAGTRFPGLLSSNRFINKIIANDLLATSFQSFLSENCLSSHTWVLARKPT